MFNKGNFILFIDSTSIKVSPDVNSNQNNQNRTLNIQKKLTTKLHLYCIPLYPIAFYLFPGDSHDVPKGRTLIESIYSKNDNYFLMDKNY